MSKTKKAHRAKVAKRNERIQNEQRQFQKIVNQIREANEAKQAFDEVSNQARPNGLPHFLPLNGSERYDAHRDIFIGGAPQPTEWKINKG